MKVLVVLSVFLFIGWQVDARAIEGSSDELGEDDELCIADLKLNRAKIAAVDMGQVLPENDHDFTTFMDCTGKKLGLLTSNGNVDYDKMTQDLLDSAKKDFTPALYQIYKQMITSALDQCHQHPASGAIAGETLIKAMNCLTRKLEELKE